MDISEVARRTGVPASTLRYYENRGLITSLAKKGLRRKFASSVLEQLALIALGRAAGLSLDEVQAMLTPSGKPNIDRQLLAAKADQIDQMISQLSAVRRGLRHAAVCPAPSHAECPTFKRLLKAAASGALNRVRGESPLKSDKKPSVTLQGSVRHSPAAARPKPARRQRT
ncbi:MerR family transcriptional regulator [Pseudomarimonas arenosa]|uniref:Helix-turn-helix domain-containing protein n=1 Tax=Pseudomarimonas arenosa TaxID=2774145 RepID=A0AAW3ZSX6_9GAMM|nr:helix-turn-helix domain-containing protein [Pseudomarimonas arenosa]